jgi:hypothetical protein
MKVLITESQYNRLIEDHHNDELTVYSNRIPPSVVGDEELEEDDTNDEDSDIKINPH